MPPNPIWTHYGYCTKTNPFDFPLHQIPQCWRTAQKAPKLPNWSPISSQIGQTSDVKKNERKRTSIQDWRPCLAWLQKPQNHLCIKETSPKMPRPLRNNQNPGSPFLPTQTTPLLEDPWRLPCNTPLPIYWDRGAWTQLSSTTSRINQWRGRIQSWSNSKTQKTTRETHIHTCPSYFMNFVRFYPVPSIFFCVLHPSGHAGC